nr:TetR/AcrR family transcriptional regulator [Micromonospora tarapacensis]
MRAVARACNVSAAAVYRHFSSQSALTRALLATQYEAFEAAVLHDDDPARSAGDRARRLVRAYVRWGLTNPGMYQLLFESADQLGADSGIGDVAHETIELAQQLLVAGGGPDGRPLTPDEAACQSERIWFGLHGIVSLRIHKPAQEWLTDPEGEAERLVGALP